MTQPRPNSRFELHYFQEIHEEDEPIDWVVENLIATSAVSLIFGPGGTKKTYALLDLAVCVATGTPWLGMPVQQGAVLIIDEESGHKRLKRRFREIAKARGVEDATIAWVTMAQVNLRDKLDIEHVRQLVEFTGAKLVIMDALADLALGADENSVKEMQPVFMGLRGMADSAPCAPVLIHHANKLGEYRGSSAILGAVDVMLQVSSKHGSGNIDFEIKKARDFDPYAFAAHAHWDKDNATFSLERTDSIIDTERFSKSEQYVLAYLAKHTTATIKSIMENAQGCTGAAARQAVYNLVKKGLVERADDGGSGAIATYRLRGIPDLTNL